MNEHRRFLVPSNRESTELTAFLFTLSTAIGDSQKTVQKVIFELKNRPQFSKRYIHNPIKHLTWSFLRK